MERDELLAYLQVHLASGVGATRFRNLLEAFGSPQRIINASVSELRGVNGIGDATAMRIFEGLRTVDAEAELELAEMAGVQVVPITSKEYPELLAACPDPPALLYVKGKLKPRDKLAIAVVGTRKPSRDGSEQAHRFAYLLAQAGITIVSGLALGIDGQAHRGALLAKGRTIAVLGCGLNHIYPPQHKDLAEQILENDGAIISEYPMNITPTAGNFPARNRIVAGMTIGTLLIDAPERSGALITAYLSLDYNREVFAIPGAITNPKTAGCNKLIQKGKAKLIMNLTDILDELGAAGDMLKSEMNSDDAGLQPDNLIANDLSDPERRIWKFLAGSPSDTDTICAMCKLSPAEASSTLTMLQLKGLIKSLPGNQFAKR